MKLQASPAQLPRADWANTVRTQRREIEDLLSDSPSLRREVSGMITAAIPRLRKQVAATLADYGEKPAVGLNQLTYTEDQVLGDWFPSTRDP
jgi:hypothetical protein